MLKKEIGKYQKCEYEGGCDAPATTVVYNRGRHWNDGRLEALCDTHGEIVTDNAEYRVNCPNCDCYFGVN